MFYMAHILSSTLNNEYIDRLTAYSRTQQRNSATEYYNSPILYSMDDYDHYLFVFFGVVVENIPYTTITKNNISTTNKSNI